MKLSEEMQRKVVVDALLKSGGDRQKAAEDLGVSFRSLNRYIKDLDLYEFIEKMGWMKSKGPPRGGGSVIRMRILAHIRKNKGAINYENLTIELYGQDGRTERQRVYTALDQMRTQDVVRIEDERWVITSDSKLAGVA